VRRAISGRTKGHYTGDAPAEVDLAMTGDTTGAVFRLQRSVQRLATVKTEADWVPPQIEGL
jgi:hypothetical protein